MHSLRHRLALILTPFLLLAGLVLFPAPAHAGSPTCSLSMTSVSFGSVNVLPGTPIDVTATLTSTCSGGGGNGQRLCFSIGSGANFSGSQRQLSGTGGTLNYDLYKDSTRSTLFGSWQTGFNASGVQVDVPQYGTATVTVYARLFGSQQTAVPGSYSTTFTADPYLRYSDKGTASCPTGTKATSTSTTVSVTVMSNCTVSTTSVSFGTVGLLTSAVDVTGQVNPKCTNTTPYSVSLGNGQTGTSPTNRRMTSGADSVTYGLYSDSSRSSAWGSSTPVSGSGSGLSQALTVYGRVPIQTTPPPGSYSDSVVVTVAY